MPKISVIIPVYNKETYLRKTLDSVLAQTFEDIEVICVDNGSCDRSTTILAEYATADQRVMVYEEPKPGAAAARNRGLSLSVGDYVCFCDADDLISPETYGTMLQSAISTKSEVVCCGFDHFNEALNDAYNPIVPGDACTGSPSSIGGALFDLTTPSVCTKLFSRALLDRLNLRFNEELSVAEDCLFSFHALLRAASIAFIPEPFYHYRQQVSGSLTNDGKSNCADVFDAHERLWKMIVDSNSYEDFASSYFRFLARQANWAFSVARNYSEYEVIFEKLRELWLPRLEARLPILTDESERLFRMLAKSDCAGASLYYQWKESERKASDASWKIAALERQLKDITSSKTFQISETLASASRFIRRK